MQHSTGHTHRILHCYLTQSLQDTGTEKRVFFGIFGLPTRVALRIQVSFGGNFIEQSETLPDSVRFHCFNWAAIGAVVLGTDESQI